jgi:PadR family transcriptional regulator, regulatory protein AphA
MNTQLVMRGDRSYVECVAEGGPLDGEGAALELVAACWEAGAALLLVHGDCLPPEFFDLKTGLAGAALLKFSNYGIRCALVLRSEQVGAGRFYEMVLEANRGDDLHICDAVAEAENWLLKGSA